jgi:iron complex transport system ATP-binding protein
VSTAVLPDTDPGADFERPALRTVDLDIGYRRRSRVRTVMGGLNLDLERGDLVCLLGRNGTGKSTLLRTIAGMQPPLAGSVQLGGKPIETLSRMELAARLSVVLTDRTSTGALTARRMVELGRYPHLGWSGKLDSEDLRAVDRALAHVGAEHLADRDSNELSDGERQRVMVARALAQEPVVLLLDEPTAFLDAPARVELLALLRRLARTEQLAIVVSTHDLDLALRLADALWLVTSDNRMQVGSPEDLVLSGRLASAFASSAVEFDAGERTFRPAPWGDSTARVTGPEPAARLAATVLERNGHQVTSSSAMVVDLHVVVDGSGRWCMSRRGESWEGPDLAALRRALRGA